MSKKFFQCTNGATGRRLLTSGVECLQWVLRCIFLLSGTTGNFLDSSLPAFCQKRAQDAVAGYDVIYFSNVARFSYRSWGCRCQLRIRSRLGKEKIIKMLEWPFIVFQNPNKHLQWFFFNLVFLKLTGRKMSNTTFILSLLNFNAAVSMPNCVLSMKKANVFHVLMYNVIRLTWSIHLVGLVQWKSPFAGVVEKRSLRMKYLLLWSLHLHWTLNKQTANTKSSFIFKKVACTYSKTFSLFKSNKFLAIRLHPLGRLYL